MTPKDLADFTADYLAPRLPWLTRFDLRPAESLLVPPLGLLHAPVGPIESYIYLTRPFSGGATDRFIPMMTFQVLYVPYETGLSIWVSPRGRIREFMAHLRPSLSTASGISMWADS